MKRPGQPRNGQPKIEVCFRGQGKRIKKEERAGWHKDVVVRFQRKAWYDEALCLEFAKTRMPEVTREARRADRESVLLCDNLYGQQTDEFRLLLWQYGKMKLHLYPAGVTDLPQLIDAGIGFTVHARTHARTNAHMHARTNTRTHARTHARTGRTRAWRAPQYMDDGGRESGEMDWQNGGVGKTCAPHAHVGWGVGKGVQHV